MVFLCFLVFSCLLFGLKSSSCLVEHATAENDLLGVSGLDDSLFCFFRCFQAHLIKSQHIGMSPNNMM